jgi:Tfp pilus assembly protein PilN
LILWAGGVVLTQAILVGLFLYVDRIVLPQQRLWQRPDSMQSDLTTRILAITQAQKELDQLKERHAIIASLVEANPCSAVLSRLVDSMGPAIWLTELHLAGGGDKSASKMKIVGFSADNEKLGGFLENLAAETMFEAVVLKRAGSASNSASERKGTPEMHIQFEIECDVSRGAPT